MSFLDVAWARLGVDPVEAGVRLVDGHDFATAAAGERGPLLVAHAHADWVLSEIKLAVEGATGDERVTILQALGTPDERIVDTTWAELDRTITADHLTSLWIPELATPVGAEYVRFHQLTRLLREQCPWDIEQTHETLVPHLLEETYEVVDAIHGLDPDDPTTDERPDRGTRRSALPDRIPRHDRRAGGTLHDRRRRVGHPRQARASTPARVRRSRRIRPRNRRGARQLGRHQARREVTHVGLRRHPSFDAGTRLRREGRRQGVEGRLRLARRRRRVPQDRRGDRRAARHVRRAQRPIGRRNSATCCSPSSTSPVICTSIPNWHCAPRPTSSVHDSRGSRRSPSNGRSTCATPTWPLSTRSGTRSSRPRRDPFTMCRTHRGSQASGRRAGASGPGGG